KMLLILDVGQVGTDPTLGVFGDNLAARLIAEAGAEPGGAGPGGWRNLGTLRSGSPPHFDWGFEGERRTLLGLCLAKGLPGAGRARALVEAVTNRVRSRALATFRADQRPMYVGDPALDFPIPRSTRPTGRGPEPDPWEATDGRLAWERLRAHHRLRAGH